MIHTENPNTDFALANTKTCISWGFFPPFSWAVGVFQAEIQVQPKEGCFFFLIIICKARLRRVITMPNWERAFFSPLSQVGCAMGIFPFALSLFLGRISLIAVQTGWFFLIFFLRERRYFREAAVLPSLCATQSIHKTFQIPVPAPNFACEETRSGRGDEAGPEAGPAPGSWGSARPRGPRPRFGGGFAEERPRPFPSSGQGFLREGQQRSL